MAKRMILSICFAVLCGCCATAQCPYGCQVGGDNGGCYTSTSYGWAHCYYQDNTCSGNGGCLPPPLTGSVSHRQPTLKRVSLQETLDTLEKQAIRKCANSKATDLRFARSHPWVHDSALPVNLARSTAYPDVEVQETVHALTSSQATLYEFATENGYTPIASYTTNYSFTLDLAKDKDVLTINHSTGTVDVLTLQVDGTYSLERKIE